MNTNKKIKISIVISICSVGFWAILLFTNEQLLLDTALLQMVIWLIIGAIQAGFVMHTPKYWKVVPIVGALAAFILATYSWVSMMLAI